MKRLKRFALVLLFAVAAGTIAAACAQNNGGNGGNAQYSSEQVEAIVNSDVDIASVYGDAYCKDNNSWRGGNGNYSAVVDYKTQNADYRFSFWPELDYYTSLRGDYMFFIDGPVSTQKNRPFTVYPCSAAGRPNEALFKYGNALLLALNQDPLTGSADGTNIRPSQALLPITRNDQNYDLGVTEYLKQEQTFKAATAPFTTEQFKKLLAAFAECGDYPETGELGKPELLADSCDYILKNGDDESSAYNFLMSALEKMLDGYEGTYGDFINGGLAEFFGLTDYNLSDEGFNVALSAQLKYIVMVGSVGGDCFKINPSENDRLFFVQTDYGRRQLEIKYEFGDDGELSQIIIGDTVNSSLSITPRKGESIKDISDRQIEMSDTVDDKYHVDLLNYNSDKFPAFKEDITAEIQDGKVVGLEIANTTDLTCTPGENYGPYDLFELNFSYKNVIYSGYSARVYYGDEYGLNYIYIVIKDSSSSSDVAEGTILPKNVIQWGTVTDYLSGNIHENEYSLVDFRQFKSDVKLESRSYRLTCGGGDNSLTEYLYYASEDNYYTSRTNWIDSRDYLDLVYADGVYYDIHRSYIFGDEPWQEVQIKTKNDNPSLKGIIEQIYTAFGNVQNLTEDDFYGATVEFNGAYYITIGNVTYVYEADTVNNELLFGGMIIDGGDTPISIFLNDMYRLFYDKVEPLDVSAIPDVKEELPREEVEKAIADSAKNQHFILTTDYGRMKFQADYEAGIVKALDNNGYYYFVDEDGILQSAYRDNGWRTRRPSWDVSYDYFIPFDELSGAEYTYNPFDDTYVFELDGGNCEVAIGIRNGLIRYYLCDNSQYYISEYNDIALTLPQLVLTDEQWSNFIDSWQNAKSYTETVQSDVLGITVTEKVDIENNLKSEKVENTQNDNVLNLFRSIEGGQYYMYSDNSGRWLRAVLDEHPEADALKDTCVLTSFLKAYSEQKNSLTYVDSDDGYYKMGTYKITMVDDGFTFEQNGVIIALAALNSTSVEKPGFETDNSAARTAFIAAVDAANEASSFKMSLAAEMETGSVELTAETVAGTRSLVTEKIFIPGMPSDGIPMAEFYYEYVDGKLKKNERQNISQTGLTVQWSNWMSSEAPATEEDILDNLYLSHMISMQTGGGELPSDVLYILARQDENGKYVISNFDISSFQTTDITIVISDGAITEVVCANDKLGQLPGFESGQIVLKYSDYNNVTVTKPQGII